MVVQVKYDRAYRTLRETFAHHGVEIIHVDQPLDFGNAFASEDDATLFGSRIQSHGYSIRPAFFVELHRAGHVTTVRALASTLAGKDDTPGHD